MRRSATFCYVPPMLISLFHGSRRFLDSGKTFFILLALVLVPDLLDNELVDNIGESILFAGMCLIVGVHEIVILRGHNLEPRNKGWAVVSLAMMALMLAGIVVDVEYGQVMWGVVMGAPILLIVAARFFSGVYRFHLNEDATMADAPEGDDPDPLEELEELEAEHTAVNPAPQSRG